MGVKFSSEKLDVVAVVRGASGVSTAAHSGSSLSSSLAGFESSVAVFAGTNNLSNSSMICPVALDIPVDVLGISNRKDGGLCRKLVRTAAPSDAYYKH